MGWQIAYREKDKKYRLWSTVSDSWLTDWSTKKDVQRYIAEDYLWEYKKHVIELYFRFPHHWPSRDSAAYKYMTDEAAAQEYGAWLQTLVDAGDDTYCEVIENTYNEVIKELGLVKGDES